MQPDFFNMNVAPADPATRPVGNRTADSVRLGKNGEDGSTSKGQSFNDALRHAERRTESERAADGPRGSEEVRPEKRHKGAGREKPVRTDDADAAGNGVAADGAPQPAAVTEAAARIENMSVALRSSKAGADAAAVPFDPSAAGKGRKTAAGNTARRLAASSVSGQAAANGAVHRDTAAARATVASVETAADEKAEAGHRTRGGLRSGAFAAGPARPSDAGRTPTATASSGTAAAATAATAGDAAVTLAATTGDSGVHRFKGLRAIRPAAGDKRAENRTDAPAKADPSAALRARFHANPIAGEMAPAGRHQGMPADAETPGHSAASGKGRRVRVHGPAAAHLQADRGESATANGTPAAGGDDAEATPVNRERAAGNGRAIVSPLHVRGAEGASGQTNAAATAAAPRTLPAETMQQIADRTVALVKTGQDSVRIQLNPESLGHIQLRVSTENQQVMIRMMVENPKTRDLLEHHIGQLRVDLGNHGLTVDRLELELASNNTAFGQAGEEAAKDGQGAFSERRRSQARATQTDDAPEDPPGGWELDNDSSRVGIFA